MHTYDDADHPRAAMTSATPMSTPADHAVHLRLVQPWTGDVGVARERLETGTDEWLGRALETPTGSTTRRFESDLVLPMREQARHMVLRKAAVVELGRPQPGRPRSGTAGFTLDVSWRSASLAPLFPVFVGTLEVSEHDLVLDGYYAPPGGELGVILDRALLNIAARGTARWFLSRVANEIEGARPDTEQAAPKMPD